MFFIMYLILKYADIYTDTSICISLNIKYITISQILFVHSYRIKNAMTYHMPQDVNLPYKNMVYRELVRAVHIHREAMMLVFVRLHL